MSLFWIVVAAALVWGVWKLSRMQSSTGRDGDTGSSAYSDGGSTTTSADCSDSSSDGGSCDGGGGDGGGGD